jgi:tetratricopeptide (TPR) repeat protein
MKFYRLLDRDAEEEALAREELSSNVALWGQDHPFVETPTRDLAEICRRQGKFVEAEQLYRRALATCEADLGPDGGTRLTPLLTGLGRVYLDQGRHADAEPLLLRAIKILEDARQRDPEEDSWLLSALEDYVSLLQREARAAEVPEVESRLASVKALVGAERVQRARHAVRDRLALD